MKKQKKESYSESEIEDELKGEFAKLFEENVTENNEG